MIKCTKCGRTHDYDGQKFCVGCGASLEAQKASAAGNAQNSDILSENTAAQENTAGHRNPAYDNLPPAFRGEADGCSAAGEKSTGRNTYTEIPQNGFAPPYYAPQYYPPNRPNFCEPLGVLGFLITMVVTAIPVIGLIFAIIWAIGPSGTNINRRNYCRAMLIISAASTLLSLLMILISFGIIMPLVRDLFNQIAYNAEYSAGSFYY